MTNTLVLRAAQQPDWPSMDELAAVAAELIARPGLVTAADTHRLWAELGRAAAGEAFVLQAGDCAERFVDSAEQTVAAKAAYLEALGGSLTGITSLPSVHIGRIAGQYAKPRSSDTEFVLGRELAVYRGDAVNSADPTELARIPETGRLLRAYDHAASALATLRDFSVYTSHEALLLDFEEALVRQDEVTGGYYGSSAHLLWIGERTRQLDSAHVAFAERIDNPVAVKVGPTTTPDDVAELADRLADGHEPGRLTFISRMGADAVADRLPALLAATRHLAGEVLWLCDPMHGNTCRTAGGEKTRVLADVARETSGFFRAVRAAGFPPGGLHLELTHEDVTECVYEADDLLRTEPLPRYSSACDPRLNPEQTEFLLARMWLA